MRKEETYARGSDSRSDAISICIGEMRSLRGRFTRTWKEEGGAADETPSRTPLRRVRPLNQFSFEGGSSQNFYARGCALIG